MNQSDEEMDALIEQYFQTAWQVAVHVQADRAVDQILNSVERALERFPNADHRFRMEHNALITPEQLQRGVELGVTFSFYIDHVYYYGDALSEDIVGPARAERFMPVQSAIDAGGVVSLHTDNPSSPIGPFRAMRTAVFRETITGTRVLGENERISVDDAIRALTINAAWQLFQENEIGSIEVGKLADFTIVSPTPPTTPANDWTRIEVVDTYRAGERVVLE